MPEQARREIRSDETPVEPKGRQGEALAEPKVRREPPADEVVPVANHLIPQYDLVIATQGIAHFVRKRTGRSIDSYSGRDASENIIVHEVPLKGVLLWLRTLGAMADLKFLAGLFAAREAINNRIED